MAYTKTVWTDGGGQSINDANLNKIEQGIKDAHTGSIIKAIYEAEADTNGYTDADVIDVAKIDGIDTRLQDVENTGMTVLSGNSLVPQVIAITPTKVTSFDTLAIDVGVGTNGDLVTQRVIAGADGVYKLRYEGFVAYASNVTITWQIYKNSAPFGNSITLSGQGADAFPITLISATNLLQNDYLELFATASAETSITISQSNGTLEKTHY